MLAQARDGTALSPFIGPYQFALDATSLGWLKDCPRRYQYEMLEGYRSKALSTSLAFGLYYHKILEYFDHLVIAEGAPYDVALRATVRYALEISDGWVTDDTSRNRENLLRSIVWYLEEFKNDPLKTITLESGKPATELSFRMELDWGPPGSAQPYLLCGYIDRIVDFNGLYVTDRKTTGQTVANYYFERYDLDNQMSLYTIAAQVVYKTPVKGVIIDAAQIAVGFTRFARGVTFRTPAQSEEWLKDLRYWTRQAEQYAEAGYWPMNERSCFLCPFKRVCSKDPSVRPNVLGAEFERRQWNPLEVR